jgi:tetratricopeptide (TPR) repeat protein
MKRRQLLICIFSFFYPLSALPEQTLSGVGEAIRRARELYNQGAQQTPSPSPEQAGADFNKSGYHKYLMGDYHGATADYTKAIQLNTKYVEAYCNRGAAELSKGDYDRAYADGNQAVALDPKYADGYLVRDRLSRGNRITTAPGHIVESVEPLPH